VLSALAGGLLLMVADIAARVLIAPQELPVGVLTGGAGRRLPAVADAPRRAREG
jgi:ABC-type Fe3+-siderophore transport system permease subunit